MCRTLCTCGKDPTRPAPPQLMCQESRGLWPRPGQLASRSRALLREAWVFLLGVLVQGTAEETAGGRGAPRPGGGTQIQQLLLSGQRAWLPPTPTWGGTQSEVPVPHAHRTHTAHSSPGPGGGLGEAPGGRGLLAIQAAVCYRWVASVWTPPHTQLVLLEERGSRAVARPCSPPTREEARCQQWDAAGSPASCSPRHGGLRQPVPALPCEGAGPGVAPARRSPCSPTPLTVLVPGLPGTAPLVGLVQF